MPPSARGCSALRRRGPRACEIARAPGDHPKSPARWSTPSIAPSAQPPWRPTPALLHGVVAHSPPSARARLGSSGAGSVSAAFDKTGGELLSAHRPADARPGGPRRRLWRPGGVGGPSPSGRAPLALGRRNAPVALCPAPRGLVAPSGPALPPPQAPPDAETEQA